MGLTEVVLDGIYDASRKVLPCGIDDRLSDVGGTGGGLSLITVRKRSGKFAPRGHSGRLAGDLSGCSIQRRSLGRLIERGSSLVGPLAGGSAKGRVENWRLNGGCHGKGEVVG